MRIRIAAVVGVLTAILVVGSCAQDIRTHSMPDASITETQARDGARAAQECAGLEGRAQAECEVQAIQRAQRERAETRTATRPAAPPPPRPRNPAVVTADTWTDGTWPLTVDGGVLACVGDAAFITTDDGRMWPLNGMARQVHANFGAEPATEPIWRENPRIPGTRVNIGPLIARARALC